MPFAGNLRTLPLPDVFQTLNNIKATGVLRLRSNAGSRDVVFNQGEIVGVGFLDKEGREDLELRLSLLGVEESNVERMKGVTWYWTAMQARVQTSRAEMDELVHEQAREQLHNLFAWATADFAFDESGPGKTVANSLLERSLERPLSIDTATILLEAAKQQDEWAELRARIRDETGAAAMGSSPALAQMAAQVTADAFEAPAEPEETSFHLYLDGEWRGPYPRQQIIGLVQTGEVAPETWSYDPLTQERKTLDQLLGGEARRITPDELESLRQAVKAAESRLSEERAGRSADLAELRGLASEILRLAHDCQLGDPAISVVVERLAEVVGGEDPSIVALAAETVIVAVVRHLRDLGERELGEARARADELARRIADAEAGRAALESQLAEAERRSDAERDAASSLRERLAAAAEDASRLNQELERTRRDPSRLSTARISALRTPEAIAAARAEAAKTGRPEELERELGRMRAEHARLHNEVAVLQARLDEDRARHEAELEASRALASSLGQRQDPPTETIGKSTERHTSADSALVAEVERLRALLAQAESRGGGDSQQALEERKRVAAEHGDTERLRKDLHQARAEAARSAELVRAAEQAEARVSAAEARVAAAEARAGSADERVAAAERRSHQAEEELSAARVALERAEEMRREQERAAYEAARQNTQLQVRLRELAARLEDGEARLGELNGLAEQLAAARSHAAELEAEAVRIRADLAAIREAATGKLDRAKRRVGELRARLREAKRDRNAMVPWSSPATATFSAAPGVQQAPVPWPSPATAAYGPGQQPVPWPSPATAAFGPGQPAWTHPPQPAGAALSPHGAPEPAPGATVRTTSGTFVPMPMPEESSAQRQRVQLPSVVQQPEAPAPRANLIRGPWAIAAAAGLLLTLGLWWGATSSVPVCERAQVNGETVAVSSPIPGRLEGIQVRPNMWVRQGERLGVVRNSDVDNIRKQGLLLDKTRLEGRIVATEAALQRAKAEHDKVVAELAQPAAAPAAGPAAPAAVPSAPAGADPRIRLRDEFAVRLVEYRGDLDELRSRIAGVEADLAAEQRRLDDLREKELVAPCDGMVLSIKESPLVQGEPAITLVDAGTLVIDAEFPGSTPPGRGVMASVYLGSLRLDAKVLGPDEVRIGRLAQSLALAAGSSRVLLMPTNRPALAEVYSQQARIAFTNGNPGILGSLGLWMRGF
jgi:hypothetical protein